MLYSKKLGVTNCICTGTYNIPAVYAWPKILFFTHKGDLFSHFKLRPAADSEPAEQGKSYIHLVSFISNDLFKRLVGKFPVFWAVAYFFLKILDSRCLFFIVNFEKLHHFYRYFCNTWIFIFEASINNILRLKKGIIVGTNTKYCHYSFILDFILLKCCLKFSAKN